jgi:F-type H+-transporting ATPase subunit b
MEETLRQIGDLLLGAVPTVVLFLILFAAYCILVHRPLARVLQERRSRTEGALEKARADIAAAEARTAEYERALRDARVQIYRTQEARRQKAMQLRATAIAQARSRAEEQIKQAKAAIAEDVARSRTTIQAEAERLSGEVISSILRQVGVAQYPVGGGK